jgi:hypothetical protein
MTKLLLLLPLLSLLLAMPTMLRGATTGMGLPEPIAKAITIPTTNTTTYAISKKPPSGYYS